MADSIKGITLKIDGDSQGLVKSLENARKSVNAVWTNLKQVNSALKLDPSNVDALTKKQDLLSKAIEETNKRLEVEKQIAEQAKEALALGSIDQNQYDALQAQILKTEASLKNLDQQANETKEALDSIGGADITPEGATQAGSSIQDVHDKTELLVKGLEVVQQVGDAAGNVLADGFNAAKQAAQATIDVVQKVGEVSVDVVKKVGSLSYSLSSSVVEAYGDYEQLAGGVQKLFGTAASTVIRNSDEAYRTAGLDANRYMETITGFSASLISGLGGDTARAAEIADQALQDMSDNANTFGTDMESIQNAYRGFSRGMYNMLDNLKLGYAGTKDGIIALINDSGILEERISSLDNITFDQIIMAIHKVQENLNIAGTTAREAESTIQGSIGMLKGAWTNFLIGLGRDNSNIDALTNNLADSLITVVNNVEPVLERLSDNLPGILPRLIDRTVDSIPDAVRVVGLVMNAVGSAIAEAMPGVLDAAIDNAPAAAEIVTTLLSNLSGALQDNAPSIIQAIGSVLPAFTEVGAQILSILVQSIIDNAPAAVEQIMNAIGPLVDQIFGAGASDRLEEALNTIVERGPEIISNVVEPLVNFTGVLIDHLPQIVDAAIPLIEFAADHLPEIVGLLVSLQATGTLAGIASSIISIAGSISMLSGGAGIFTGLGTAASGAGTAVAGVGTAAGGAATSLGAIAATAGPIALLVGEVVTLGLEAKALVDVVHEGEEAGISATESIVGGILTVVDTCNLGATSFSDMWYEYNRATEEATETTQTFEQQAQQTFIDIGLSIEQSGAAATQSVADDCAIIQGYLDNLEANGQVELRARVITEYQTIMTQNAIANGERSRADYYSLQGRRRNNAQAYANSVHAQADSERAERYRQQGEAAIRAVEETAQTAQRAISSYGGGGSYSGGGGGGGGSSRSNDEDKTSALTASNAEELLTAINDKFSKLLEKFGIQTEPTEYQNNVNQMIDGLLKALEANYNDASIEAAKAEIQKTMSAYGLSGDINAQTLEQLRGLVNSQPVQNTEAFAQVQSNVAAIQQATVDYTPHFNTITGVLGQLLALKQNESNTVNVYVGNELLDTYIQQSLVNQSLVSGGV